MTLVSDENVGLLLDDNVLVDHLYLTSKLMENNSVITFRTEFLQLYALSVTMRDASDT